MQFIEKLSKIHNVELYGIALLFFFTLWFIFNTIQYYKGEKRNIKHLHRFAKEGETDAQIKLAKRYQKGTMLKKDCQKAAFWYQHAAFSGDNEAKGHLRAFLNQHNKKKKC